MYIIWKHIEKRRRRISNVAIYSNLVFIEDEYQYKNSSAI